MIATARVATAQSPSRNSQLDEIKALPHRFCPYLLTVESTADESPGLVHHWFF